MVIIVTLHGRIVVSTQPAHLPGMGPLQALWLAFVVLLAGITTVLAASVDPWLLVMLAGLAITGYAVFDRTGDGWVLSI